MSVTLMTVLFLNFLVSLIFLLPLKDEQPPDKRFPLATSCIVLLNVAVHVVVHHVAPNWFATEEGWKRAMWAFLLTPSEILEGVGMGAANMITAAFMHAGWSHLVRNMFILFFFGRRVEKVLGPRRFTFFYLVSIFVSGIGSVVGRAALPMTQGQLPSLGASGAVMAVLAAYMFLYSQEYIRTIVMVVVPIPFTLRLPVWVFVAFTVLRDMIGGWLQYRLQALGSVFSLVDFFAHLGGFLAGILLIYLFLPFQVLHFRYRPQRAIFRNLGRNG